MAMSTRKAQMPLMIGCVALVVCALGTRPAWSEASAKSAPTPSTSLAISTVTEGHPSDELPSLIVRGSGVPVEDRMIDAAVLADIKMLAESRGDSAEEWIARETQTEAFTDLVSGYASNFPDAYLASGTVAEENGTHSGWITLADKPTATVLAELKQLPIDTRVRYGIPGGVIALKALQASLTSNVDELLGEKGSIGSHLNPETGVIEVNYDSQASLDEDAIAEAIQQSKSEVDRSDDVQVSVVRGEVGEGDDFTVVHGGSGLYKNNAAVCTSGFSAKIPNGSSGIITADHCGNPMLFQNISGAIQVQIQGIANTDMQFYRTLSSNGHTTKPEFFKGNEVRTVEGTRTAVNGDPVCRYGFYSGLGLNACNVIESINHCYTTGWGQACGLVFTDTLNTTFGDSGGPYFWGAKAVGIVKGGWPYPGLGTVSTFTSINLAMTKLGVNITTG